MIGRLIFLAMIVIILCTALCAPELAADVARLRRLARHKLGLNYWPGWAAPWQQAQKDTYATRSDGMITASGGSITVTPAPRHAAGLPRRRAEREQPWTATIPAVIQ